MRFLLVMLVLTTGVLVAAPGAQAADPIRIYQNQATGDCLFDTNVRGLGADVCYWTDDTRWVVHLWPDNTVRLGNVETGRCISDEWGIGLTSAGCNDSENQSWWVTYWGDDTRRFQNQLTGHCLDYTRDNGLRTWECNSGENQSWYAR